MNADPEDHAETAERSVHPPRQAITPKLLRATIAITRPEALPRLAPKTLRGAPPIRTRRSQHDRRERDRGTDMLPSSPTCRDRGR